MAESTELPDNVIQADFTAERPSAAEKNVVRVPSRSAIPQAVIQKPEEDVIDRLLSVFLGEAPSEAFNPHNKNEMALAVSNMHGYLVTKRWWREKLSGMTILLVIAAAVKYLFFSGE